MASISIIIPHYNDVAGLKRLFLSIEPGFFSQILVIDDASDASVQSKLLELVANFDNLNVSYYIQDTQKGAGAARNEGLKHLNSDFVIFVDSDDVLTKDANSILAKAMAHDVDVVYVSPTSHNVKHELGTRHRLYQSLIHVYLAHANTINEVKLCTHFFVPVSKVIKTSLIKAHNITFDETPVSNDVMFSLKVGMHAQKIAAFDTPFYNIYQHSAGLTQRTDKQTILTRAHVFINYVHTLSQHYEPSIVKALKLRGDHLVIFALRAHGIAFAREIKQLLLSHNVKLSPLKLLIKTKTWI